MFRKKLHLVLSALMMFSLEGFLWGQTVPELNLDTGKQIYEAACIGCHGPAGKGQPESTLGFERPPQFPDFSDCNGSTRERKYDWNGYP